MKMYRVRSRTMHGSNGGGPPCTTRNHRNNQEMYWSDRTIWMERNAISHTRVAVFNFCSRIYLQRSCINMKIRDWGTGMLLASPTITDLPWENISLTWGFLLGIFPHGTCSFIELLILIENYKPHRGVSSCWDKMTEVFIDFFLCMLGRW